MARVLGAYREYEGEPEQPTAAQLDVGYANLVNCDPDRDIALVHDAEGRLVSYVRASYEDVGDGTRDLVVFAPTDPDHIAEPLFEALVDGSERHMLPWAEGLSRARFRGYSPHPGPGEEAAGEARWWEERGYVAAHFWASLVRPHLDDVPDLPLPDGVEVRPVEEQHLRPIWEAHQEAFRGEWDWHEPTEEEYVEFVDDPLRDTSLWKIAWSGDEVVGQVKSFVNDEENEGRGYLRGYTENISTHADWRGRGIAGALLAMSLRELRDRGLEQAALGADTDSPGGAFHLYTRLGFELQAYGAVYERDLPR